MSDIQNGLHGATAQSHAEEERSGRKENAMSLMVVLENTGSQKIAMQCPAQVWKPKACGLQW